MKKLGALIAFLVMICLISSFLPGCGKPSSPGSKTTDSSFSDSDIYSSEREEDASAFVTNADGTITYTNRHVGYRLIFPAEWKDRFAVYLTNYSNGTEVNFVGKSGISKTSRLSFFEIQYQYMGDEGFESEMLGQKNGEDILLFFPHDIHEALNPDEYNGMEFSEEEKNLMQQDDQQYELMEQSIQSILATFEVLR